MLSIRLQRVGKKNTAVYRLVLMEKARKAKGRCIENLGSYNPHTKKVDFNVEKIKHWLNQGAEATESVNNLLINHKIIEGKKQNVLSQRFAQKKAAEAVKAEELKVAKEASASAESSEAKKEPEKVVENKIAEEPKKENKPEDKPAEQPEEIAKEEKPAEEKPNE